MTYPIVHEFDARQWHRRWTAVCMAQNPIARVEPPDLPETLTVPIGADPGWDELSESIVEDLDTLLSSGEAHFESEGSILVHQRLPDHEALRDPNFWTWFAVHPGRKLIERRYPFKPSSSSPAAAAEDGVSKRLRPTPSADNFVGSHSRETLFFRLWIRAEMARLEPNEDGHISGSDDPYELARPGMVDFWRSHVLRPRFPEHRPLLHAFVDFQFPKDEGGNRGKPRLTIAQIRQLAKDLSKSCANITVELLDREACAALIDRVWTKTERAEAWKSPRTAADSLQEVAAE